MLTCTQSRSAPLSLSSKASIRLAVKHGACHPHIAWCLRARLHSLYDEGLGGPVRPVNSMALHGCHPGFSGACRFPPNFITGHVHPNDAKANEGPFGHDLYALLYEIFIVTAELTGTIRCNHASSIVAPAKTPLPQPLQHDSV